MKGKSKDEAKEELEKSGLSGAALDKILPHKVTVKQDCVAVIVTISIRLHLLHLI